MVITQWHVPIDDHQCYWYSMFVSFGAPVDAATMRAQRITAVDLPSYAPRTGRHDNWGYDPGEQAAETYTGMGPDINVHDQWAVESPGRIHDRTREHLSPADVGLRTQRRLLLAAMNSPDDETLVGLRDPAALAGPPAVDAICTDGDIEQAWRAADRQRREHAPWSARAD